MVSRSRAGLGPLAFSLLVFLPFAFGHFMSYVMRSINAILGPTLVSELALSAAQLGVLTSAYFFAFALAQLPVGMALDRFGPRRVQVVLLSVAMVGCLLFSRGTTFLELFAARALMGVGLAACFMASLKAVSDWLPSARMPSMNGYLLAIGGLGAIAATSPSQLLMASVGWRELFLLVAVAIGLAALVIAVLTPEPLDRAARAALSLRSLIDVYRDRAFQRTIFVALIPHTVFFAIQGLWLAAWLKDGAGLGSEQIGLCLLLGSAAMVVSTVAVGRITERLAGLGVAPLDVAALGLWSFAVVQLLPLLDGRSPAVAMAVAFPVFGAFAGLEFAIVAQSVAPALTGRASTCLNLLLFTGAFVIQAGFGAILGLWTPDQQGAYPPIAYRVAFGILLLIQLPGLLWWASAKLRKRSLPLGAVSRAP
jgi:predicted MFS family arabinose efflux permease